VSVEADPINPCCVNVTITNPDCDSIHINAAFFDCSDVSTPFDDTLHTVTNEAGGTFSFQVCADSMMLCYEIVITDLSTGGSIVVDN